MKFKLLLLIFVVSSLFLCQVGNADDPIWWCGHPIGLGGEVNIDLSNSLPQAYKLDRCQGGYQIEAAENQRLQNYISGSTVFEGRQIVRASLKNCIGFRDLVQGGRMQPKMVCYKDDNDVGTVFELSKPISLSDLTRR